jgi:hypothetical protein
MIQASDFNSCNSELEVPCVIHLAGTRATALSGNKTEPVVSISLNASCELYRVIQACLRAVTIAGESVCTEFVSDVLDSRGVA